MKRHLLNLLTVLSTLGFLAAAALFCVSHATAVTVEWNRPQLEPGRRWSNRNIRAWAAQGRIAVQSSLTVTTDPEMMDLIAADPPPRRLAWESKPAAEFAMGAPSSLWERLGFERRFNSGRVGRYVLTARSVMLPLFLPTGVFAILPGVRAYRHLRRTRLRGRCAQCGYDLRATPGRCAECGTPAPVTAKG